MARKKVQDETQEGGIQLREFAAAIGQIAEEKGISKDRVIETVEAALAAAYKKDYGKKSQKIRAEFDDKKGVAKFFLVKEVVDETTREFVEQEEGEEETKDVAPQGDGLSRDEEKLPRFNPERDMLLEEAAKINPDIQVGEVFETELEPKDQYGRIAAQTAKQVIIQRIREAERDAMFGEYKEKEGEVVNGTVQRIEGRTVFVDLGKAAGALFPSEQIETEHYRIGQRLKVYISRVEADPKGPGITLSRTSPEMVRRLFELEVPEIFGGTVEIKAIAREAGSRTKIAVSSKEEGIDPIGSCVGQKGIRVQTIIDELGGEKVDIIEWNDDVEKFIKAALNPAKVLAVEVSESGKEAVAKVPSDQLSLAIGKRGQNVRLAVKLTGWKIDVVASQPEEIKEEVSAQEENTEEEKSKEEAEAPAEKKEKKVKKEKKEKKAKKSPSKKEKGSEEAKKEK